MSELQAAAAVAVHAGELDPMVLGTISASAGTIARIIAQAAPNNPRVGLMASVVLSTVSLWVWAFSYYAWSREGAFALYVAWGVVLAATYGIFTGSSPATISAAANTLSGGRVGTPKE